MKRNTFLTCIATLWVLVSIMSCTPEKDSPQPNGNPPVTPPPPPVTDTVALFTDKIWVTKKVYKDGVEQTGSWMIGTSYGINKSKSYSFNIPGYPSAGGTWDFDPSGKHKVNFETGQGPGFKWTILSLNKTSLVAEEKGSDGSVTKFEFSN